ncbi:toprim domain-containing protein [uncultured Litoreibacter sp.]|uniref:DUF7146 domain-containing protein n=1 Tax=uncultured Litoreibacter sp. TaxID=1392394 RepID=UPI0026228248|nr:toprim domain-containing protein [uncultured Litoreibacter sp.]
MSYQSHNFEVIDPNALTANAGGKWHGHYGAAPCPICQPERRKDQNALSIKLTGDRLLLNCKKAGCDFRDLLASLGIRPGGYEIDRAAQAEAERKQAEYAAKVLARAREMWRETDHINGTMAEAYLRSRGITCDLPPSLRFHPKAYHGPRKQGLPAMVSDVAKTGGIHRTFFELDGNRLDRHAKMMQGPCRGSAVRLSETLGPLVVCEGIETGLSLLSGLLSGPHTVWAALSTSGIKGLHLPKRVGDLIVARDGDDAGKLAANGLASRAHAAGWKVKIMPAPDGLDFNDVLQTKGGF